MICRDKRGAARLERRQRRDLVATQNGRDEWLHRTLKVTPGR
jgi:hypothetical protein